MELKTLLTLKEFVGEVEESPEVFLLIGREATESVEVPEEVRPVLKGSFKDVMFVKFRKGQLQMRVCICLYLYLQNLGWTLVWISYWVC